MSASPSTRNIHVRVYCDPKEFAVSPEDIAEATCQKATDR